MIVAFCGKAGSGKDAAASVLRERRGAYVIAQSDPMKEFCRLVFDFSEQQLYGPSACRNGQDPRYPRPDAVRFAYCHDEHTHGPECGEPVFLTPREALQTLGTEWGRAMFQHVWVDFAIRRARTILDRGVDPVRNIATDARMVVISDVRFRNELSRIRAAGGRVVRIVRPGAGLRGDVGQHPSETEQDSIPDSDFDGVVANDGTLDDLAARVLVCVDG